MSVVTDVDTDLSHRGVEHRVPEISGPKVELLPKSIKVRNVMLAVFSQVGAVGVDDRRGVVENSRTLLLVHREHHDHAGERREPLGDRTGHRLGVFVVLLVLHDPEVGAVEELLEADHLGATGRRFGDKTLMLGQHRFLVASPSRLRQCGSDHRHWQTLCAPRPARAPIRTTPARTPGGWPLAMGAMYPW
ncbi:Uncharacterised protein [Mycobacteroides abscessus subsp. massiliense]|nr:Uncharacterised protein [Mycobacteroides abscessus subsp. massiliense]